MTDENLSAFEALRLLRSSIWARLQKNEDFRVLTALDRVLADLSPGLPKVQQPQVQAPAVKPSPNDFDTEQPAEKTFSTVPSTFSTVPSKNGFGARMAELAADSLHFATAR